MADINFRFEDLYDILDEYLDYIGNQDRLETEEKDGSAFVIKDYKIIIPKLGIYFMDATLFTRNPEYEEGSEKEEWDVSGCGYLVYDKDETDINSFSSYIPNGVLGMQLYTKLGRQEEVNSLECILSIDFDK